ncbi:MAG: hypothetical protein WBQ86_21015 [Candidatus Binatus sp.]
MTKTTGRIAFVSKEIFDTTTGIAEADAICANEASAASLSGTFQALLSTSAIPAATRPGFDFSAGSAPYVRPDGIKIADAPSLATGGNLDSGIWQNADGTYVTALVAFSWTGSSTPSSSTTMADTCNDWSSNSNSVSGDVGVVADSVLWWTTGLSQGCNGSLRIYCLQE